MDTLNPLHLYKASLLQKTSGAVHVPIYGSVDQMIFHMLLTVEIT